LVVATVLIYLILAIVAITTYSALCALDSDLQSRVTESKTFLKNHPNGFAGVPAKTIMVTIQGQERTIGALGVLHCP
jgi:hypothetical protein